MLWNSSAKILGRQQPGATPVDFCNQHGVYLLHHARSVVYVGRTTDRPLGKRLFQHTSDRLDGRWDRFSWFGVYPVGGIGSLETVDPSTFTMDLLIVTMEALLIEGFRGRPRMVSEEMIFGLSNIFKLKIHPIEKNKIFALIDELKSKL